MISILSADNVHISEPLWIAWHSLPERPEHLWGGWICPYGHIRVSMKLSKVIGGETKVKLTAAFHSGRLNPEMLIY